MRRSEKNSAKRARRRFDAVPVQPVTNAPQKSYDDIRPELHEE
jgi:hypothetical protein